MIYFERIDVSKGIDINKTSTLRKHIIYQCLYFLDKGFRFQSALYNGCHDILMMAIDLNSIAITDIHGLGYFCIIAGITRSEAMNLL